MLVFPAHGTLGALDEVMFFAVVVIFVGMMGVSWLRSQSSDDAPENDPTDLPLPPPTDENRFELK